MWQQLKMVLVSGIRGTISVLERAVEPIRGLRSTLELIDAKYNKPLRDAFQNSYALNVVKYAVPVTAIEVVDHARPYILSLVAPWLGISPQSLESYESYSRIAVQLIYLRFFLQITALNTFTNLAVSNEVKNIFDSTDRQLARVCEDDNFQLRLMSEAALQAHFAIGESALATFGFFNDYFAAGFMMRSLEFLLKSYWRGALFKQYALAPYEICGTHQIALCSQDRLRCLFLGLTIQTVCSIPMTLTVGILGQTLPSQWNRALENLITLFAIMHARNLGFRVPFYEVKKTPVGTFDPLVMSWKLALVGINSLVNTAPRIIGSKLFSFIMPKNLDPEQAVVVHKRNFCIEKSLQLLRAVTYNALVVPFPRELLDFSEFLNHPNTRKYSPLLLDWCEQTLTCVLDKARGIPYQIVRNTINVTGVKYPIKLSTRIYLTHELKLSPELAEAVVLLIAKGRDGALLDIARRLLVYIKGIDVQPYAVFNEAPKKIIEEYNFKVIEDDAIQTQPIEQVDIVEDFSPETPSREELLDNGIDIDDIIQADYLSYQR